MNGCTTGVGLVVDVGVVIVLGDEVAFAGDGEMVGFRSLTENSSFVEMGSTVGEG